jgi:hypothetical protein
MNVRNVERDRAYSVRRRDDPEYKAKQAIWNKAWREKNAKTPERLARKAEQMRFYAKDPVLAVRHKARRKVRHEMQMGRMVRQPCEICGEVLSQAHHDDYSKPLEVRWLCRLHHREHHAKAEGEPK